MTLSGVVVFYKATDKVGGSLVCGDGVREKGQLEKALIMAGAVRFRPIVLTAAAVVVGSFVMLFDPIFQGLVIAMMFGAVGATILTLIAAPLLYFEFFRKKPCPIAEQMGESCELGGELGTSSD